MCTIVVAAFVEIMQLLLMLSYVYVLYIYIYIYLLYLYLQYGHCCGDCKSVSVSEAMRRLPEVLRR